MFFNVFLVLICFCSLFSVCSEGNWGDNCTLTCSCVTANTRTCDGFTGTCDCLDGWTGSSCHKDIYECNNAAIHQCPDNSECQNTKGSFYCQCNTGYLKAGDATCQGTVKTLYICTLYNSKILYNVGRICLVIINFCDIFHDIFHENIC